MGNYNGSECMPDELVGLVSVQDRKITKASQLSHTWRTHTAVLNMVPWMNESRSIQLIKSCLKVLGCSRKLQKEKREREK
jgi:hypothetical protein